MKFFVVVGEELNTFACEENDVASSILGVYTSKDKALKCKEEQKEIWFNIVIEVWDEDANLIEIL